MRTLVASLALCCLFGYIASDLLREPEPAAPPGMVWIAGARQAGQPGFWIDASAVTNAQFDVFVRATGHLASADWRHPQGPGSGLLGRESLPVMAVNWDDANAYAHWAGKRLPTEAEWALAVRAGVAPGMARRAALAPPGFALYNIGGQRAPDPASALSPIGFRLVQEGR